MKTEMKAVVASIVVIALALSAVSGIAYSWFSDTETSTIDVSTAKVNVEGVFQDGITVLDSSGSTALDTKASVVSDGKDIKITDLVNHRTITAKYDLTNKSSVITNFRMYVAVNGISDEIAESMISITGGTSPIAPTSVPFDFKNGIAYIVGGSAGVRMNAPTADAGDVYYFTLVINSNDLLTSTTNFSIKVVSEAYQYDYEYPKVFVYTDESSWTDVRDTTTMADNIEFTVPDGKTAVLDNGVFNEGSNSRNVTIKGDSGSIADVITKAVSAEGGQLNYQRGSTFTFENLTINAGEGSFDGIVCDKLIFKGCTITGKLTLYGKATFIDCTFENTMADQYSIWTWGGTDVDFEKCTFNTNGKAILLYGKATADKPTNLTVNNCTFNDCNNGTARKAAIEIGNDYNATYNLVIKNITVNGFADGKNTGSKIWANKNSMDAEHLSVIINGVKIQ